MTHEDKQKLAEQIAEKAMSVKNVTYAVVLQAVYEALNARDEEMKQLRNPWISVKDRLPETGADIIYLMNSGTPGRNERYRKFDAEWFRMNVRHWQYTNDPELKKGE